MIIKRIVTISLFSSLGLMLLLLLVGLFVPTKALVQLSKGKSADKTVVAVGKDGKVIEGATVKVQADGTTVVVDASGNTVAGASAAASTTATGTTAATGTTTTTGGSSNGDVTPPPSTGGGTATPPPATGGGTTATPAATASISATSTSIAYNASTNLSWSSTNATGCTITPTIGAVNPSGSGRSTGALTITTKFTITCTGGGGSGSSSVTITVAAAPVAACGAGGACHLSDITGHSTSADCRSAVTSGTAGQPAVGAYQITAAFITAHNGEKNGVINTKMCGRAYAGGNLRNFTGSHKGPTLSGKSYDGWMANFYLGAYN